MIRLLITAISLALPCFPQAADAPQDANRAMVEAAPRKLIWREPRPATVQDWKCGFKGCDFAPTPPFQFVREDLEGTTPKLTVKDSHGRSWAVKFGAKAVPESFGYRFVTALGYLAEPSYFVQSGVIQGAANLRRARDYVKSDGSFRNARFQIRDKEFEFLKNSAWSLADNPFRGTHEFAGLRITMMLLSNWDAKDERDQAEGPNTAIFRVTEAGNTMLFYSFFDWGSTLGRWGGLMRRDRSDCSAFYADTPHFVKGINGGVVEWGYLGKNEKDVTSGITVEDVRWLAPYLKRISREDLQAGLKASGATERQTACWAGAIEDRIRQLDRVAR